MDKIKKPNGFNLFAQAKSFFVFFNVSNLDELPK